MKRLHHLRDTPSGLDGLGVSAGRLSVPFPSVLKRLDLGRSLHTMLTKEHVVVLLGVEWRIKVDEINSLVLHVPSQHV